MPFPVDCFLLYNHFRDMGNNQIESGSESGKDRVIKARNPVKLRLVQPTVRPKVVAQNILRWELKDCTATQRGLRPHFTSIAFRPYSFKKCSHLCVHRA